MRKTCKHCQLCDDHDFDDFLSIYYCLVDGYIGRNINTICRHPNEFIYQKEPIVKKHWEFKYG